MVSVVASDFGGVQGMYNQPLQTSEDDEDDSEMSLDHDDEDKPAYLHSGKLQIPNRDQLPAKME